VVAPAKHLRRSLIERREALRKAVAKNRLVPIHDRLASNELRFHCARLSSDYAPPRDISFVSVNPPSSWEDVQTLCSVASAIAIRAVFRG
jgi:hypothetical protein